MILEMWINITVSLLWTFNLKTPTKLRGFLTQDEVNKIAVCTKAHKILMAKHWVKKTPRQLWDRLQDMGVFKLKGYM